MSPSLFVISGRDQGAKFELEDGMMGLGRDSSNFIQVHDTEVSRRHAEIRREGEVFTVIDLGSSNGTFVNGERVGRHALASGDRLQVGSTLILFTDPGDAPAEDLSDKIDIVMRGNVSDNSRIVRSMSQEEGSAIFQGPLAPARGARLDHARSNLQIMYRTTLAVSHTQDIDQLLTRIMQLIFDWVEADRGCVMLLNEETKQLEPKVHHHRLGIATDEKLVISRTILDYVTQRGEGVLTSDARDDDRWTPAVSILKMGVREAICVPMQGRYGMVGVIYIDTSLTPQNIVQQGIAQRFTDEHLKLMIAIAHQAALAVEDTRYHQAMVQAERLAAVGQTIATLSHHIKNILQGIRGGSYLIEMGLAAHDEAVVRKGWGMVERNQNKISSLVMDMLTFSKEREPEPVAGDLNTTVAEVIELMQTRANELEVALDWHGAPDMPQIAVRSGGDSSGGAECRHQCPGCVRETAGGSGHGVDGLSADRQAAANHRRGQRRRHPNGRPGKDLHDLRVAKGESGDRAGAARQPKDSQGTWRPDPGRKPGGRGEPIHFGIARRLARRQRP